MRTGLVRSVRRALFFALAVVITGSGGCGPARGPREDATSRTMRDDLDSMVRMPDSIRRVVTLAPNLTEIVCALGAERRLVGITTYCDYPPSVAGISRVGDMIAPSIEAIAGLSPDLVFLTVEGNTLNVYEDMRRLGVRVFVSNPRSFDGILRTMRNMGAILHREADARRITDSLAAIMNEVALHSRNVPDARRPSVLFIVSLDPLIVAGRGSFVDEMAHIAGARNAGDAGAGRFPVVGREEVLRANPDVILVSDDIATDPASVVGRFNEWAKLRAARSGNIRIIDADIFLRPGPRVFGGLRLLHSMVDDFADATSR